LIAFGASIIKPAITGTVQRTCNDEQRPVGFSIYYTLVNIGGFLGPNYAGAVTAAFGIAAAFPASAIAIVLAMIVVLTLYKDPGGTTETPRQSFGQRLADFGRILGTPRLMTLFLLVAGFWSLFFQFFGAFTIYLTQDLHLSQQRTNFIISLDAALIIVCQVGIGYLTRHWSTARAVWVGALIGAAGFGVIGLGMSQHLAALGVVIFSIGEMVYSAHFYKYLGSLAPRARKGCTSASRSFRSRSARSCPDGSAVRSPIGRARASATRRRCSGDSARSDWPQRSASGCTRRSTRSATLPPEPHAHRDRRFDRLTTALRRGRTATT
jgi:dipeptide/tripeptide permease